MRSVHHACALFVYRRQWHPAHVRRRPHDPVRGGGGGCGMCVGLCVSPPLATHRYFSTHRYDDGQFYPGTGAPEEVGAPVLLCSC